MRAAGRQMAGVFATSGCIVAAVTLLLFYQLRDAAERSETFSFTVWFVVLQEVVLFGGLALTAFRTGATTAVPVRAAHLTTIVLYNIAALATVGLFNFVLLPQRHASANTYYTIAVAETGLWLALLMILRVVDIAHHAAHGEASAARAGVDEMLVTCDRVRSATEANGWRLAQALRELADRIRFSEGLRRNGALAAEFSARLNELEAMATAGGDETAQKTVERLVREISIMATRRG